MKYTLAIFLLLLTIELSAQEKQFPKDENGKFIYYKVVDSQSLDKSVLIDRATNFFTTNKNLLKIAERTDTSILATGKLIIDKTVLVVGHPSGELNYNLYFQVKEGKYRYWLTDFTYIPYQRDRYGNFVAKTNITTPLEKQVDKLNAGSWRDVQAGAYAKVAKLSDAFKKYLATDKKVPVPAKEKTISTKKW